MSLGSTAPMALFPRFIQPNESCTFATCDILDSYYPYRPSLPANAAFTVIFAISLSAYVIQGITSKRFIGFSVAMVCGTLGEASGYASRVMSYNNPWKAIHFKNQSTCLFVSPAFLAAAIYITLSRIVVVLGPQNSRLPAVWYPRIFISADIFAILVQVTGAVMLISARDASSKSWTVGKNTLIAGLICQVVTSLIFILLAIDFGIRTRHRIQKLGDTASDSQNTRLHRSSLFRGFLAALSISSLAIFVRCVYRLLELSDGFDSSFAKNQTLIIALDGVMIAIAVVVLNVFHPGMCFKEGYEKDISVNMKNGGKWRPFGLKSDGQGSADAASA